MGWRCCRCRAGAHTRRGGVRGWMVSERRSRFGLADSWRRAWWRWLHPEPEDRVTGWSSLARGLLGEKSSFEFPILRRVRPIRKTWRTREPARGVELRQVALAPPTIDALAAAELGHQRRAVQAQVRLLTAAAVSVFAGEPPSVGVSILKTRAQCTQQTAAAGSLSTRMSGKSSPRCKALRLNCKAS